MKDFKQGEEMPYHGQRVIKEGVTGESNKNPFDISYCPPVNLCIHPAKALSYVCNISNSEIELKLL